jgi:CopG family transcriptional regulator/antitoxin EndoAI
MNKRLNILLPEETLAVLDRVAKPGNRSRFIDLAVRRLIETEGKTNLREQLKAGYLANAGRDLKMAAEWFPLEEEAWDAFERTATKPVKKPCVDTLATELQKCPKQLVRAHQ